MQDSIAIEARPDGWQQFYFGEFERTPHDDEMLALASEYYDRTEAFDRTVCTGPVVDGGIRPVTYRELGMINRHATQVLRELQIRSGDADGLRVAMRAVIASGRR